MRYTFARYRSLLAGVTLAIGLAGCSTTTPVASTSPSASTAASVAASQSGAPSSGTGASPSAGASASTSAAPNAVTSTAASAAASPSTAPAPSSAASAQATPDITGAVQTVLNYFRAINDQSLEQAYQLWANNGAAGNQTLDQFKQGFAGTAGINLQLGAPTQTGAGQVNVPITLTSITNDLANPQNAQRVQHFTGTYTLEPAAGYPAGWQIVGANVTQASVPPAPAASPDDATKFAQAYYAAINRGAYAEAYTSWSDLGRASRQDYAQFVRGFAATKNVTLDLGAAQGGGAAGSTYVDLPVVVHATQQDGSQQTFCGTYTLRRLNVPPFDQFGWHIYSARIAPVGNVEQGSAQAQQLLSNGCQQ